MWLYSFPLVHGFEDAFKNILYDGYICIYLHEMLLLKQEYLQPNAFLQRDKIKAHNDGESSTQSRTLDPWTQECFSDLIHPFTINLFMSTC